MLPTILEFKLMSMTMAGWMAAASPVPMPGQTVAFMMEARAAAPVEVKFFDENLRVSASFQLRRDGSADPETTKKVTSLFRCRFTNHEAPIAKRTLAMLVDVSERYHGKSIEFVSAHRATAGESYTSPHRAARAIDFRIRDVELREVRDYLWRKYTEVGVGWYPSEKFIHIDPRPGLNDTSWTYQYGTNHYKPYWAELARQPDPPPTLAKAKQRRPGS